MNGRNDFASLAAALNAIPAALLDTAEVHDTTALEHRWDAIIEDARFDNRADRVLAKYDDSDALFPDADGLADLGFDKEPLASCLEKGKVSPQFVAKLVKRVRGEGVDVDSVNLALWRINGSANARSLHRHLDVLDGLGFDMAAFRLLANHGLMNGTRARSLVHRVCTGSLDLDDANTALSYIAADVREGRCGHCH